MAFGVGGVVGFAVAVGGTGVAVDPGLGVFVGSGVAVGVCPGASVFVGTGDCPGASVFVGNGVCPGASVSVGAAEVAWAAGAMSQLEGR